MFKAILRAHTEMLLNPFFELLSKEEDAEEEDEAEFGQYTNNNEYVLMLKYKLDDIAKYYEGQL